MRFLTIFRPAGSSSDGASDTARPDAMRRYAEEQTKAGVLLSQAMLNPSMARVHFDGSEFSIDEASESIAGYAFVEAPSMEVAIEGVKAFLHVAGAGTTEVRQVLG